MRAPPDEIETKEKLKLANGVGDWMKLRCGDRVAEREGRHVGRVEAIVHSHIIRVRWEDSGWISEFVLRP